MTDYEYGSDHVHFGPLRLVGILARMKTHLALGACVLMGCTITMGPPVEQAQVQAPAQPVQAPAQPIAQAPRPPVPAIAPPPAAYQAPAPPPVQNSAPTPASKSVQPASVAAAPATRSAQAPTVAPATAARFCDVNIVDAVIGMKVGNKPWDPGGSTAAPALAAKLAKATLDITNPEAATVEVLVTLFGPKVSKPDIEGDAILEIRGKAGARVHLEKKQDDFNPHWGHIIRHVPLDGSAQIHVILKEDDMFDADDHVGDFWITDKHIKAALKAEKKLAINVADQTAKQVLFFGIHVVQTR